MTFAGIVCCQIGNVFVCRSATHSAFRARGGQNRLLYAGVACELLLLAAVLYVPPLASVFGLAPLGPKHWLVLSTSTSCRLRAGTPDASAAAMRKLRASILVPITLLVAGCVSQGKYDQALTDAAQLRAKNQALATDAQNRQRSQATETARLKRALEELTKSATLAAAQIEGLKSGARECGTALDDATAINQQLRNELERQGKNVDALLTEKGTLASALTQTKARLEELRRAQAAAETRAALFRDVALKLRRMVDAGELVISLRSGRMVLALPNDVLFDSGKTTLKPRGKAALEQVTAVLKTLPDRKFQIAGHTDDEPIRFSPFQSNWQLATQRALVVVDDMIALGMPANAVSAAGYAEFDPVAGNDSTEGRAKNRRIEITLQPKIDEFVAVPTAW